MQKSAILILCPLLLASACNEVVMEPQKYGSIALSLSSDVGVEVRSAAEPAESVALDDFIIDISGETFLGVAFSDRHIYGSIPETGIEIPFGTYVIEAQNCDSDIAESANGGLGCARYAGSSDQLGIFSYEPVAAEINCTMQNAKVSFTFDGSFLEDFTDESVLLICGGREFEFDSVEAASSVIYCNVPAGGASLTYTVSGYIGGNKLNYTHTAAMAPAKWTKIVVKSNHNGLVGPDISVDGSLDDDKFSEIINPDGGIGTSDGEMNLPSIIVDTEIDAVETVDCELDVLD